MAFRGYVYAYPVAEDWKKANGIEEWQEKGRKQRLNTVNKKLQCSTRPTALGVQTLNPKKAM